MNGSTTDVIVARSHDVDRLSTMVMWSVAAHVVVTAIVVLVPHSKSDVTPKEVMTITIGGAPGPRTGMTQMGQKAVQAPEPPIKQTERAPSPKPEMSLPDPNLKPRQQPKNAPKEAAAKTLTTGAEPQEGTAKAETRVRGQGFGLSSGGGGSTGGVTLDVTDFCCPDYILTMKELVTQNWVGKRNRTGLTKMMFTILKDGRLEGIRLETSSGSDDLDNEAARALRVTRLPPLPSRYPNPTLTVHLEFAYER
jgi:TonB family protein